MAFSVGSAPPPPIWRRRRGDTLFTPPTGVERLVVANWRPDAEALRRISGRWEDGSDNDDTSLSGRWRATFPAAYGDQLVLIGRARGDLRGLRVRAGLVDPNDPGTPVTAYWLGLDSYTPDLRPPRGWHPWAARVPMNRTIELHATGGLRVSLLLARIQRDFRGVP